MNLSTSTNIYFNRPDGSKASIEASMRLCAQAGYRVMDMNFHDCTTFSLPFTDDGGYESWLEGLGALAEELGLTFGQAHAPFYNFCDGAAPDRERMDALLLRAIDCSARLGIPWLVLHAGTAFGAADWRAASKAGNRAYFLPVVEYATKKGVGLAFENLWDLNIAPARRYTAQTEELVELVDSFDCESVACCCDVEHLAIMGQDVKKHLRLIGHRLRATHISDCIDMRADHLLPYSGTTDWAAVMEGLREIGYTGDFTYEIHRYTAATPDALVLAALAYSVRVGEHLLSL